MRRLYRICCRAQYALWLVSALGLAIAYVSSFFVSTLHLPWRLIHPSLIVLAVSSFLSLVIVSVFVYETAFPKEIDPAGRPGFLSALPSMIFLTALSFFVWR